jgi:membrane-associated PAP2 superfamily phosphatase
MVWINGLGLLLLSSSTVVIMQWLPNIDFAVSDWFYQVNDGFVYRTHWLWRDWLHDHVRVFIKPAKFVFCVFLLFVILWPTRHRFRAASLYTLLTMLACNGVVSWIKGVSGRACPNELTLYGGHYSWQPLFSTVLEKPDGHCWPGGHALHGFLLLPLVFAVLLLNERRAMRWSLTVISGFSFLLSLTQIICGQHFLSHQLATLFFCWLTSFLLFIAAIYLPAHTARVGRFFPNTVQKNRIVNG